MLEVVLGQFGEVVDRAAERAEIPAQRARFLPRLVVGARFTPLMLEGSSGTVTREQPSDYFREVVEPLLTSRPDSET